MGKYVREVGDRIQFYDKGVSGRRPLNEIHEEQVGWSLRSPEQPAPWLEFPNISSCTAIALEAGDGSLFGCHLTVGMDEENVDLLLRTIKSLAEGARMEVTHAYLVGSLWTFRARKYHGWTRKGRFRSTRRVARQLKEMFPTLKQTSAAETQEGTTWDLTVVAFPEGTRWGIRLHTARIGFTVPRYLPTTKI